MFQITFILDLREKAVSHKWKWPQFCHLGSTPCARVTQVILATGLGWVVFGDTLSLLSARLAFLLGRFPLHWFAFCHRILGSVVIHEGFG